LGDDLSIAGRSGSFGIALGGAVSSHLIIYGRILDSVAPGATGKIQGPSDNLNGMIALVVFGGAGGITAVGVGGGMAYYLDSNLFFAGSLLGSRLLVDDRFGNSAAKSDVGFTFEGQVGKEWWVSENWGLGVAGQVLLGLMSDSAIGDASTPTWRLAAFSLLLSATFN
jgi:hypothetical protein